MRKLPMEGKVSHVAPYRAGNKDPKGSVTGIHRHMVQHAKIWERTGKLPAPNVPCGDCDACCCDIAKVEVVEGDDPSLIWEENSEGMKLIPRNADTDDCMYLTDIGCSVYEKRPKSCRFFDCRLYAIAGIAYAEDSDKLNIAIQAWDMNKFLKTQEDKYAMFATRVAMEAMSDEPGKLVAAPLAFANHKAYVEHAKKIFKEAQDARHPNIPVQRERVTQEDQQSKTSSNDAKRNNVLLGSAIKSALGNRPK